MKNRFLVLLGLVLFVSCKRRVEQKVTITKENSRQVPQKKITDSQSFTKVVSKNQEEDVEELENKLKIFPAIEYQKLDSVNMTHCGSDSGAFFENLGIILRTSCNDVCETSLLEIKSGKSMLLPADFDAGLLGLEVSLQCDRFITYSSYDMPDYNKYYAHRALLVLYNTHRGVGLKVIKKKKMFSLNAWSIMEVKWVDKKSIALKLYKEAFSDKVKYEYFKVQIEVL